MHRKSISSDSRPHAWFRLCLLFAIVVLAATKVHAQVSVLTKPSLTNGQFGFTVVGQTDSLYEILASTNAAAPMTNWTSLGTLTNLTGSFSFSEPTTNLDQRFYRAQHLAYPRRPVGVYAKVVPSDIIKPNPAAKWDSYFNCLYGRLLADPAISGLMLGIHWDLVNPADGVYDWSYIQDAFYQVSLWNSNNPGVQKSIQFNVTPGFNSPGWVLTNIMSSDGSCDPILTNLSLSANCGAVTFIGYNENADGNVLPLPWNATYKAAWSNFLGVLNQQYGNNPLLVSITIAGPTAGSEEMILPNDGNTCLCHTNNDCGADCGTNSIQQPNGLTPREIWNELLLNHYGPSYTNSNRAFVEEWTNAINLYESIFSNLTLVIVPANGKGFPFDSRTNSADPLCKFSPGSSCTAVSTILDYFENCQSMDGNGKACQTSGLGANLVTLANGDVGIAGVRFLSAIWQTATPRNQILGGALFDHGFSLSTTPAPEQEEFNVLANFFNGTSAVTGTTTFPGLFSNAASVSTVNYPLTSSAPLNFLQVYNQDVLYAQSHGCVVITNGSGDQTISLSAQDLLNAANQLLFTIALKSYPPGPIHSYSQSCSNSPTPACEPP